MISIGGGNRKTNTEREKRELVKFNLVFHYCFSRTAIALLSFMVMFKLKAFQMKSNPIILTQFCFKYRSNPGTPTQPRRPDFISVGQQQQPNNQQYYDFHPSNAAPQIRSMSNHNPPTYGGSPQRRFLSEGELVRQGAELSYARTNNTVDNIRELAGSPQRGIYMWKDTSPGAYQQGIIQPQPHQQIPKSQYYCSNPTSPTNQYQNNNQQQPPPRPYHPALRGGVAVFPPAPAQQSPQQVRRKAQQEQQTELNNLVDRRRRPMSFVRALEVSDSMELQRTGPHQQNNVGSSSGGGNSPPTPDRTSVYDMNYEISV